MSGLVVISGPSGSGKSSVCRALNAHPDVVFSVSSTTRPMRDAERDGVDYHFVTPEQFEQRVRRGAFLEHASYSGNRYGTERAQMERALADGKVFLLEIEVQGTRHLRDDGIEATYVFVVPPSMAELRRRLVARGTNSPEEIARRMEIAEGEMTAVDLYDHVVVNEDLDRAIASVRAIIGL